MVDHSNDGLRTLVIASKTLDARAYAAWSTQYRKAVANLDELEKKAPPRDPNLSPLPLRPPCRLPLAAASCCAAASPKDARPHDSVI